MNEMSRELSRSKQQVKRLKDCLNKRRFIYEWKFHFISIYLLRLPFNCRFIKETLSLSWFEEGKTSCLRDSPKVTDRFGTMAINLKARENLWEKDLEAVYKRV